MRKILFYLNTESKKEINLSKIGFKIRKLNTNEYKALLNEFVKIILEGKELELAKNYNSFIKNTKKISNEEELNLIENLSNSDNKDLILDFYSRIPPELFDFLTIDNIKNGLYKIWVAEANEVEFNKNFHENYIDVLITKLIDFCNYINSNDGNYESYKIYNLYTYSGTKDKNLLTFLFIILSTNQHTSLINIENLYKLEKMFKTKDKDFCFSFLVMIDTIFQYDNLLENSIINKVSFLERLLISKEEEKTNAFVLKIGILCNSLFDISNEDLSKRLKELYKIRSLLVHGDTSKIINNIDLYKRVFSNKIEKKENKQETKHEILLAVDVILNMFLIRVLDKYLDNPNLCEYMKLN